MKGLLTKIKSLRRTIEKNGIAILRVSLGLIFVYFGALKFSPHSAAETLATDTISWLTGGNVKRNIALALLAIVECGIGTALLMKRYLNVAVFLLYFQMCGTLLPLAIFTDRTWSAFLVPSLEGQYIIKNAVLFASAIVVGASARGGKLITHPKVAKEAERKEDRLAEGSDVY